MGFVSKIFLCSIVVALGIACRGSADSPGRGEGGGMGGEGGRSDRGGSSGGVGGISGENGTAGTGGTTGWPTGFIEVSSDYPEIYGQMQVELDGRVILPSEVLLGDCSGDSDQVFEIPEGNRTLSIRSKKRFLWKITEEIEAGRCLQVKLIVKDSLSSMYFYGNKDEGPGYNKFPCTYHANGDHVGTLNEYADFVMNDIHQPGRSVPEVLLPSVARGHAVVIPINEDDAFPFVIRKESPGGHGEDVIPSPQVLTGWNVTLE